MLRFLNWFLKWLVSFNSIGKEFVYLNLIIVIRNGSFSCNPTKKLDMHVHVICIVSWIRIWYDVSYVDSKKCFEIKIPMKLAIFECTNGNNTVLSYEWDRNHIEIHVISCNLSSTPLCCCSVGETYFGTGWCWRHYMWVTEFKKTKLPKRDNKKSPHVVVRFEDHQHFFRYLSPNI